MFWIRKRENLIAFIALALITIVVFSPIHYKMIYSHPHNDFSDHIAFARSLSAGEPMPEHIKAHPIWQISIVFLHVVFHLSLENAAVILQVSLQLFLAGALFFLALRVLEDPSALLLISLPILLMLVSQIMLFAGEDNLYYLGYLGINIYHNPTINMLKPFAVILFIYSTALVKGDQLSNWHIPLAASIVILSTLIKPNLIICLLPAVGFLLLLRLVRNEKVNWWFAVIGLAAPAALVLGWQFSVTYQAGQSGLTLAPFQVMQAFSDHLLLKFILSIWFPLLASGVYLKETIRNTPLQIAWLSFFFGAGYTYLLAEEGARMLHANWGWSGDISLFILFAAAVFFFFNQYRIDKRNFRWWGILVVGLLPHLAAGIIYYFYVMNSGTFV